MLLAYILTCIEVFIKLCEALGFLGHIDESDIFFQNECKSLLKQMLKDKFFPSIITSNMCALQNHSV